MHFWEAPNHGSKEVYIRVMHSLPLCFGRGREYILHTFVAAWGQTRWLCPHALREKYEFGHVPLGSSYKKFTVHIADPREREFNNKHTSNLPLATSSLQVGQLVS